MNSFKLRGFILIKTKRSFINRGAVLDLFCPTTRDSRDIGDKEMRFL